VCHVPRGLVCVANFRALMVCCSVCVVQYLPYCPFGKSDLSRHGKAAEFSQLGHRGYRGCEPPTDALVICLLLPRDWLWHLLRRIAGRVCH
jgi:hypothetical protein